ncbi:STAS domain-containing protein [Pseudomonas schmalbachii]|uniref:STAS domain-containing protein n=1 Tax=Pseudomonas schmalbachii TaxID=2816993 RepID=A0ABS3TM86_9PSED|nr:STAS domain-containing protein [Pseudomonas schmalbachii]MBO3274774.1 STAS domain-containing protein [Pseudomonas schmalbachii]
MARIASREEAGRRVFAVVGELNIYSAAQLKDELVALLDSHGQLEVDLGSVDDFDSTGVQLLLMFKREAQRRGGCVTYTRHSERVREALDLLNLVAELGDPLVIPLESGEVRP